MADLHHMVTSAVAVAIQNVPAPVNVQSHEKPEKYKGEKGRDVERFISQCEAYWVTASITDQKTRVMTAIGRLSDKAAQWAIYITDHVASHQGSLPTEVDSWDKLKVLLRKFFGEATPEEKAIMELEKLTTMDPKERATRDVGLYVSEFNSLISRISGLSDKDKEIRFIKGLPNRIFAQLTATESPPTNFNEWTERSLKVYSAFERIREKEAADKKPALSSSAPKTQNAPRPFIPRTPANSQHVPMDVDASRVDTRVRSTSQESVTRASLDGSARLCSGNE